MKIPRGEGSVEVKKEKVKKFLEFRKEFSKREWQEINHAIDVQLNKKAEKLKLDDSDIQIICDVIFKLHL